MGGNPVDVESLVSQLAEFSSDGRFIADAKPADASFPKIIWCNAAACEQSGYARSVLLGGPLERLLGGGKRAEIEAEISDLMQRPEPIRRQFQNHKKDGSPYWVSLTLRPACDPSNPCRYWLGFLHDISDFEKMRGNLTTTRQKMELSQKRLWDAIEALPDAFVMYDKENRLVVCNSKYKELYSASAPAIFPNAKFEDIMRFGIENGQYPEAEGREEAWLKERLDRRKRASKPFERELPGNRYIVIHDVETQNGDIVGLRTDVTELRRKKIELERLSSSLEAAKAVAETESRTDPLTKVGNRRGLDLFMDSISERCAADSEIALIHVDLDHFKEINDIYGHSAGDYVLCIVANMLCETTTSEDYVARVGGDEFVIVLPSNNARNIAEIAAKRIITECEKAVIFEGYELEFSASIGIAVAEETKITGLMEKADVALYDAKAAGRGRYVCFTPVSPYDTASHTL